MVYGNFLSAFIRYFSCTTCFVPPADASPLLCSAAPCVLVFCLCWGTTAARLPSVPSFACMCCLLLCRAPFGYVVFAVFIPPVLAGFLALPFCFSPVLAALVVCCSLGAFWCFFPPVGLVVSLLHLAAGLVGFFVACCCCLVSALGAFCVLFDIPPVWGLLVRASSVLAVLRRVWCGFRFRFPALPCGRSFAFLRRLRAAPVGGYFPLDPSFTACPILCPPAPPRSVRLPFPPWLCCGIGYWCRPRAFSPGLAGLPCPLSVGACWCLVLRPFCLFRRFS